MHFSRCFKCKQRRWQDKTYIAYTRSKCRLNRSPRQSPRVYTTGNRSAWRSLRRLRRRSPRVNGKLLALIQYIDNSIYRRNRVLAVMMIIRFTYWLWRCVRQARHGVHAAHVDELSSLTHSSVHWSEHIRSSYRNRLAVPSVKLSIGSRSFSVSGPTVWNALPDYLRNPILSIDVFKRYLKTFFICSVLTRRYSALETLCLCAI